MATQTLLDMTQEILSAMSSDEVNSISDTTESMQVATIIKRKYYDIAARGALPEHSLLFQLNPSNEETSPTLMFIPDNVSKVEWLKYFDTNVLDGSAPNQFQHDLNLDIVNTNESIGNAIPGYGYVTILPIDQFLDMVNLFNPLDSNVGTYNFNDDGKNFTFYYKNNKTPQYCTVISNFYVIFDSYDASQDSTLQASKTMAWGQKMPSFKMQDSFIPDIDDQQFPLLLNESKALAFYELKQTPHAKAEQEIKRGWSSIQKDKSVTNKPSYFDQLANFGRMPRTGGYGKPWPYKTTSLN